jgi:hypothetical protein
VEVAPTIGTTVYTEGITSRPVTPARETTSVFSALSLSLLFLTAAKFVVSVLFLAQKFPLKKNKKKN